MASTVWRGYISFGLISIPVRLYRAARAERISLRRLYRPAEQSPVSDDALEEVPSTPIQQPASHSRQQSEASARQTNLPAPVARPEPALVPVTQVSVRKGTDEVLAQNSVVKGYEYEKGRFVAVESEELKNAAPKTSAAMEIAEFVQLSQIDPVYFETSYYVTPEEAGEKAYALLYRAMQLSGLVALAQFAMHSREHAVVLRPGAKGLLAHTMFYASEVRADEEFKADVSSVSDKELTLAQTLIQSLEEPFEPEKYRDTYREKIQALIDSKVQGQALPATVSAPKQAEVVDIADALRRSLANLRKPASSITTQEITPAEPKAPTRTKRAAR